MRKGQFIFMKEDLRSTSSSRPLSSLLGIMRNELGDRRRQGTFNHAFLESSITVSPIRHTVELNFWEWWGFTRNEDGEADDDGEDFIKINFHYTPLEVNRKLGSGRTCVFLHSVILKS